MSPVIPNHIDEYKAMSSLNVLLSDLIRFSLQILQAYIGSASASPFHDDSLLTYRMCQNDNYSEIPPEAEKVIRFFPAISNGLERYPRFHALCRALVMDGRLRKLTMPDGKVIPGTEICLGFGVLISILWRYLNITKDLSWNQAELEFILSESEQTLNKSFLSVDIVLPLMGLSGKYRIPHIDLDRGWYVRNMQPEEIAILNKHILPSTKLPCTMAYPGDAPPPFLHYALVKESLALPFSALVPPGNVINPEFLPYAEIDLSLSILQISTAQAMPSPESLISSPAFLYKSNDWAMNTFGNPFNINFSWPPHQNFSSPRFYRPWFAAPGNWDEWIYRILSFINAASDDERRRIHLALRWYAESVKSPRLEDR